MIVLCMRTDKPEAELYLYNDTKQLETIKWQAHRELSTTLHRKIDELFDRAGIEKKDLGGIVLYKGPGSFTGLRIGFAVGNALASIMRKPIVSSAGNDWLSQGVNNLLVGKNETPALPKYGAPAATTLSKSL